MLSEIEDRLLRRRNDEPARRLSTVVLTSKNGYNHVLSGLRSGDSVYLVDVEGSPLLRLDWDPITGRFAVFLSESKSDKYVIYPGSKRAELLK